MSVGFGRVIRVDMYYDVRRMEFRLNSLLDFVCEVVSLNYRPFISHYDMNINISNVPRSSRAKPMVAHATLFSVENPPHDGYFFVRHGPIDQDVNGVATH